MSKITRLPIYLLFISIVVLTLTYLSDLYNRYFEDTFYEGYVFTIKILLFDTIALIPLVVILIQKNRFELKLACVFTVLLQQVTLFLDFKIGALYGVIIGLLSAVYFIFRLRNV